VKLNTQSFLTFYVDIEKYISCYLKIFWSKAIFHIRDMQLIDPNAVEYFTELDSMQCKDGGEIEMKKKQDAFKHLHACLILELMYFDRNNMIMYFGWCNHKEETEIVSWNLCTQIQEYQRYWLLIKTKWGKICISVYLLVLRQGIAPTHPQRDGAEIECAEKVNYHGHYTLDAILWLTNVLMSNAKKRPPSSEIGNTMNSNPSNDDTAHQILLCVPCCPPKKKVRQCKEADCMRVIKKAGKCASHGQRCKEEGCTKTISKAGKCASHGQRCKEEGCTNAISKAGKCVSHGQRCKEEGCTNAIKKAGRCASHGSQCREEGCTKTITKDGRCKAHGPK
jgi:hypothetical protein